jgi:hypothetical protein
MADPVDALKAALEVQTDLALAARLGLERSTIAQWRRRGSVPTRYRFMLQSERRESLKQGWRIADRRQVYGDGDGRFILSAALACVPTEAFEFPKAFSSANVGWARESLLMNVVQVVLKACREELGKATCESHDEFVQLVAVLDRPDYQEAISHALRQPVVGEL